MIATGGKLVPPHGGTLKPLLLQGEELAEERRRAASLPKVPLNSKEASDSVMLAMGAFSPLEGFLGRADYLGTVERMELSSGVLWPIPVTVSVGREVAAGIREGQDVALVAEDSGEVMAMMTVQEKYPYDRTKEAREVFGTEEEAHPGVQRIYSQGEIYLGGPVRALSEGRYPAEYPEFARPAETRRIFTERGWSAVAAFQTRNPIHRSHEYLIRIAMEVSDGVFIHPIVGALKSGDIPADVRMKCYQALIDRYLPAERVVLKVYPMEMRYGGPREAVLHAIIRQNFGCSHLIIGRDHAGVGKYYGPFEAQEIFDRLTPGALAIRALKLDWTFWCYKCGGMASLKSCPHSPEDRLLISGTELRALLSEGRRPPEEFSRPEVLQILTEYYRNHKEQE
ncbi:MAG: sulfate adenylyltransferase [Spirochaetales bacterium]|nr:sulfate adenylyltransferase [Spirochaetales bacterium]